MSKVLFSLLITIQCKGQILSKIPVEKKDYLRGVLYQYEFVTEHDRYMILSLLKNKHFEYSEESTSQRHYSSGLWKIEKDELILNSSIQSDNVPIRFQFNTEIDSVRWQNTTPVQVPKNLNGDRLSDSRVYLNDSSTFCFPFFDTCIGIFPKRIKLVKVDFGNGFTSRWTPINRQHFKLFRVVAVTKVDFNKYVSFRNKRYKISDKAITPIN